MVEIKATTLAAISRRRQGVRCRFVSSGSLCLVLLGVVAMCYPKTTLHTFEPTNIKIKESIAVTTLDPKQDLALNMKDKHVNDVDEMTATATIVNTPSSKVQYPLAELNLSSATTYYERGFWQQMNPVPLDRWSIVDNTTCIPHPNIDEDWQKVPRVLILGAQKAGTTALAYYLYNHPNIPYFPTKELVFFDEIMDQQTIEASNKGGINASFALQYYQEEVVPVPMSKFQDEALYGLDATPNYLLLSDRAPQRIFCTAPWAKLIVLLRNPIDRAFSQYHMQRHRDLNNPKLRRGFATFEEAVDMDLAVLVETGVLQQANPPNGPYTPIDDWEQEYRAWQTYTKLGVNSLVGRGLYAIQLRHWLKAMQDYGKPRSDLYIKTSEEFFAQPNATFREVLDFLSLPPHQLPSYRQIHPTHYGSDTMHPETRAKLQAVYEPFRLQLQDLLGPEWKDVWT